MFGRKGVSQGIATHGRVPYMWGDAAMQPGQKPHGLPAILNQPIYNWWIHEGREERARLYAEGLAAVGVSYAPTVTFERVQRPQWDFAYSRGPVSNE